MSETVKKRLTQEQIELVSSQIACLKDKNLQQRAFVSLLAAEIFSTYLEEIGIEAISGGSLYSVLPVFEHFDLAPIAVKNNVIIDIRAVLGESFPQMCIPAEHVSREIKPDIYVGAKIDKDLENIEFTGFVKADGISCQKGNRQYFVIDAEEMSPISKIDEAIASVEKNDKKYLALDHQKASGLFIPFIDGTVSDLEREYVLQHLLNCEECRRELIELYSIDSSLKNVKGAKSKLLLEEDYTLRLFSGDPLLEGKEVKIEFLEEEVEELEETVEEEEVVVVEVEAVFMPEEEEEIEDPEEEITVFDKTEEPREETINLSDEEEKVEEVVEAVFMSEEEEEIEDPEEEITVFDKTEEPREETINLSDEEEKVEEVVEAVFMPEEDKEIEEPVIMAQETPVQERIEKIGLETAPEPEEQVKEEPAEVEESALSSEKKTKRYVDWADELVHKQEMIDKPLLADENIPKHDLNEFFDETDLEKGLIEGLDLSEENNIAEHIGLDENDFAKKKEPEKIQPESVEKSVSGQSSEEKAEIRRARKEERQEEIFISQDEEVENILDNLDKVETLNEEDDIESLFSVFGKTDALKPPQTEEIKIITPVEDSKPDESIPAPKAVKAPEPQISTAKKDGDYGTILSSGKKEQDTGEEFDILLYEEGRANVEIINQEELMNIFNSDESNEKAESRKIKRPNLSLGSLFKDRSIVAFTVAISLSTTVLFLYLGQINQQINIVGTDVIKKPERTHEKASNTEKSVALNQESGREPMMSYTREVVKTVKEEVDEEVPGDILKKSLAKNGAQGQETAPEPEVVDIQNISWELSASVANEPEMKSYFVDTGYILKSRLAEDLYMPGMQNNGAVITIYAELDTAGNILVAEVKTGSGSEEIDRRCVETFRSVIKTTPFPNVELNRSKIKLNLIISI